MADSKVKERWYFPNWIQVHNWNSYFAHKFVRMVNGDMVRIFGSLLLQTNSQNVRKKDKQKSNKATV